MQNDLRGQCADEILALYPFYHKKILHANPAITGMQIAQIRVLGVLARDGLLPVSEIGKRLYISKPYMTKLIDTLIAQDYVRRLPDQNDRRVIRIRITENGMEFLKNSTTLFRNDVKQLLSGLAQEDLNRLHGSLSEIRRILEKIS